MAKLDDAQLNELAALAHLSLSEEERASFAAQLDDILAYAERIQALGTDGVVPTSHALLAAGLGDSDVLRPLRDDEPGESLDRERALEGAPDAGAGLFRVPKVLP